MDARTKVLFAAACLALLPPACSAETEEGDGVGAGRAAIVTTDADVDARLDLLDRELPTLANARDRCRARGRAYRDALRLASDARAGRVPEHWRKSVHHRTIGSPGARRDAALARAEMARAGVRYQPTTSDTALAAELAQRGLL